MSTRIHPKRAAIAGAMTGLALYFICLTFFLLVYRGQGSWMLAPFMPGLSTSGGGLLAGLGWSVAYGAGIPWLFAFSFNAAGGTAVDGVSG